MLSKQRPLPAILIWQPTFIRRIKITLRDFSLVSKKDVFAGLFHSIFYEEYHLFYNK